MSQQLDQLQPKRGVDVDTNVLTRNYLDRLYLNTIDKVQAKGDLKKENERVEKASGSKDVQSYGEDNPESTIEPKGKAGRPPKYMKTDEMFWKSEKLKVIDFNTVTWDNIEINKVGKKKTNAYAPNGNEMTRAQMIKIFIAHNKTMQSQATGGM